MAELATDRTSGPGGQRRAGRGHLRLLRAKGERESILDVTCASETTPESLTQFVQSLPQNGAFCLTNCWSALKLADPNCGSRRRAKPAALKTASCTPWLLALGEFELAELRRRNVQRSSSNWRNWCTANDPSSGDPRRPTGWLYWRALEAGRAGKQAVDPHAGAVRSPRREWYTLKFVVSAF